MSLRITYYKSLVHRQLFDSWGLKRKLGELRPGSFPFISGDTFREACDFEYTNATEWPPDLKSAKTVFCGLNFADDLINCLSKSQSRFPSRTKLVLHNGDQAPSFDSYQVLVNAFAEVYSINVTSEVESLGVVPIPQGLENRSVDRSGRPGDYPRPFEWGKIPRWDQRLGDVFASFRTSTNPKVRQPIKDLVVQRDMCWVEPTDDQARYLEAVREHRFVISPRGNGPDCHRTWEAIYWGAIPVLESGSLPVSLTSQLPVVVTRTYDEFLSMTRDERLEVGQRALGRPKDKAWMSYWCRELLR